MGWQMSNNPSPTSLKVLGENNFGIPHNCKPFASIPTHHHSRPNSGPVRTFNSLVSCVEFLFGFFFYLNLLFELLKKNTSNFC